eukprot:1978461-Pyramimonas_sp.AAC.1
MVPAAPDLAVGVSRASREARRIRILVQKACISNSDAGPRSNGSFPRGPTTRTQPALLPPIPLW